MASLDPASALAFLSARGVSYKGKGNIGYLNRLVRNITAQEAAGLPVNRQAARGHVYTPEHPGRRRPIIPDNPRDYSPGPSRYAVKTRPLEPRLRPAITIKRPFVHSRDITQVEDMIEVPGNALIVTTGQQARAMTALRNHRAGTATFNRGGRTQIIKPTAERPGVTWRVRIDIFDCSSRQRVEVFTNRSSAAWHKPEQGITVDYLLAELTDSEMSLEEFLIRAAMESYAVRAPLTHICHYTLIFTPSDANYWSTHN